MAPCRASALQKTKHDLIDCFAHNLLFAAQTTSMKPFRYGVFAKLVIGTFLSFFLLFRIEGVSGGACFSTDSVPKQLCCSAPEYRFVNTNQTYKIAMDIPGVHPQDLDVSVDHNSRTVKLIGNRRDDDGDVIGCFQKSWNLDDSVDLQSLVMQHDNGVLTIWAPKDSHDERRKSFVSKRSDEEKSGKKAFVRGSTKLTKAQQATVTKLKPVITRHIERHEDPVLPEEDPMVVEPIAYDEQELLESVSVLTDDEGEYWFHRM